MQAMKGVMMKMEVIRKYRDIDLFSDEDGILLFYFYMNAFTHMKLPLYYICEKMTLYLLQM